MIPVSSPMGALPYMRRAGEKERLTLAGKLTVEAGMGPSLGGTVKP